MKIFLSLILGLIAILPSFSQTNLSIGEWKALFPFIAGTSVTQSPTTVYYSSKLGIVGFDKKERTHRIITRVEGLSSAENAKLIYHKEAKALVAVYNTGIVDVIEVDGIQTMKDIANFDNIPIDRNANFLFDLGGNSVLLSADYGISQIDIVNKKVLWTSFTLKNAVHAALKWDGRFYAATDDGLFMINEDDLVENFKAWTRIDSSQGLPIDKGFEALAIFNNTLFVGFEEELFMLDGDKWSEFFTYTDFEIQTLTGATNHLLANYRCTNECNSKVVAFDKNLDISVSSIGCANRINESLEDEDGWIWYADEWDDFRLAPQNGSKCEKLSINSPFSEKAYDVAVGLDEVVVTSGGTVNGFRYSFRNDGFFVLDKSGTWTSHNIFNTQELKDRDLKNFHRVAIHPETGDQYHATYWGGIVVYHQDGTYSFYDESNSVLRVKDENDKRERCTDVTFDQENNLWVTTFLATENSLAVLLNDGTWKGFNPPGFGNMPNQVAIDQNGYKWITLLGDASKGVYVFDEGDINDPNDDRGYLFKTSNSELPTNNVICVTVDIEGDVWVGTDQGAVVFECGTDIFDGGCTGNRRKVEQDSIIGLLLETEEVRCIEVDGANRKWFGTRNGIYVQSPSGEDQVFSLNEMNSPLASNFINDIAIDQENGTAYIATDKGLMAYKSDATSGGKFHSSTVLAYPNPVRPGYDGPIAIRGLARNAEIRITDISGQLVYQTEALGGQAIWDGKDYNGRRAESGIYLVFSTSEAGDFEDPEALVTKILIMN